VDFDHSDLRRGRSPLVQHDVEPEAPSDAHALAYALRSQATRSRSIWAALVMARQFLTTLMRPELLRLRRLVISTADQFPEIGRSWYEQGFERALATLATQFGLLSQRGLLRADDPLLAAHHFVGLLLWIPINRAMFTGDETSNTSELKTYAGAATEAFLRAYGANEKEQSR
jgi:hypothetical protein